MASYPSAGVQSQAFLDHINGLVQERRKSRVLAMELCFSCTNTSVFRLATVVLALVYIIKIRYGFHMKIEHLDFPINFGL